MEPQAEYEQLTTEVLRLGNWLMGGESDRLTQAEWDEQFDRYKSDLERLRALGDQLRPTALRERRGPLTPEGLEEEIAELFAT